MEFSTIFNSHTLFSSLSGFSSLNTVKIQSLSLSTALEWSEPLILNPISSVSIYSKTNLFPSRFGWSVEQKKARAFEIRRLGQEIFMSASFDLAAVSGAVLKLCFSSIPSISARFMRKALCCSIQQSHLSFSPTVSMRLRPKRWDSFKSEPLFLQFHA